jgi:hypothetical protein
MAFGFGGGLGFGGGFGFSPGSSFGRERSVSPPKGTSRSLGGNIGRLVGGFDEGGSSRNIGKVAQDRVFSDRQEDVQRQELSFQDQLRSLIRTEVPPGFEGFNPGGLLGSSFLPQILFGLGGLGLGFGGLAGGLGGFNPGGFSGLSPGIFSNIFPGLGGLGGGGRGFNPGGFGSEGLGSRLGSFFPGIGSGFL